MKIRIHAQNLLILGIIVLTSMPLYASIITNRTPYELYINFKINHGPVHARYLKPYECLGSVGNEITVSSVQSKGTTVRNDENWPIILYSPNYRTTKHEMACLEKDRISSCNHLSQKSCHKKHVYWYKR